MVHINIKNENKFENSIEKNAQGVVLISCWLFSVTSSSWPNNIGQNNRVASKRKQFGSTACKTFWLLWTWLTFSCKWNQCLNLFLLFLLGYFCEFVFILRPNWSTSSCVVCLEMWLGEIIVGLHAASLSTWQNKLCSYATGIKYPELHVQIVSAAQRLGMETLVCKFFTPWVFRCTT